MDSGIVSYGFQYGAYLIQVGLIILVARSSHRNRLVGVLLYLSCLLATGLGRTYALRMYGLASRQYSYVYWTTDFLLVISAFLLVCLFFRRACLQQEKMWRFVRLLLTFICVLVVSISGLLFSHHYGNLLAGFIVEFSQNLYFTCLVLNTLLYLLLQQIDSVDDQLGLLVCGVGIQFAGPAATFALVHLTANEGFAQSLNSLVNRFCTLGMILVWAYAIVHVKEKATQVTRRQIPVLAEVAAHLNIQV
jgi:hypothetical protein